jgi:DNA-binding transcriptional LysR family regulator
MDLRHFETFLQIAELKSFTKTAEAVCLTQPTVSKQIVELERFFDVKLIDRTKRTVSLTGAGELLLTYARDFVNLKKNTIDASPLSKASKKAPSRRRKHHPRHLHPPQAPQLIQESVRRYTDQAIISDTKESSKRCRTSIDIGFVGAKKRHQKTRLQKIVDDTIVMIAPPTFPDTVRAADIKDYPL